MEKINLEDIVKVVDGKVLNKYNDLFVCSIVTDSREKTTNGLFVAIKGENTDGHLYIEDAVKNGAVAVIVSEGVEKFIDNVVYIKVGDTIEALKNIASMYRDRFNIPFIAVTGSVGKTTTKEMIAQVLETKYLTHKTKGNLNSNIGAPLTVLSVNYKHQMAVVEMGMDRLGQIASISSFVKPDIAVITNIGMAHIEFLKTRENIFKAKCEVFENLKKGGTIILNRDDDMLVKINNDFKKIWFGKSKMADIRFYDEYIDYKEALTKAKILVYGREYDLEIKGLSLHLIYSALPAIAVGMLQKIDMEDILKALRNYKAPEKRMELFKLNEEVLLINDTYNANPQSMKSLIDTVSDSNYMGKILILGDMFELGEKSILLHKEVISYALSKNITKVIVIGEIMKKAYEELDLKEKEKKIFCFEKKEDIYPNLQNFIKANSIIAVKASRGMKFENITEKILEKNQII